MVPLKYGQNRVSNSWDIAIIEFPVDGGNGGCGGGGVQSHFHVKPNLVEVKFSCIELWLSFYTHIEYVQP